MTGLRGKRIVIIGGSSGIGAAVAAAAIAEGADIVIGSSSPDRIAGARSQLGGQVEGHAVDVTREESIREFFDKVGALDHLVYTAGDWDHMVPRKISEVTIDDLERTLAVRFTGAVLAIKYASSRFRGGGSIVLTDGIVTHMPRKGMPLSSALGGAIEHLVQGLAVDMAPLRINSVCPGAIGTAVWDNRAPENFASLPLARMGTPDEVAQAYLYLMKGGYTTGQVLRVDGGRSLV